jgi:hypothetical protein
MKFKGSLPKADCRGYLANSSWSQSLHREPYGIEYAPVAGSDVSFLDHPAAPDPAVPLHEFRSPRQPPGAVTACHRPLRDACIAT